MLKSERCPVTIARRETERENRCRWIRRCVSLSGCRGRACYIVALCADSVTRLAWLKRQSPYLGVLSSFEGTRMCTSGAIISDSKFPTGATFPKAIFQRIGGTFSEREKNKLQHTDKTNNNNVTTIITTTKAISQRPLNSGFAFQTPSWSDIEFFKSSFMTDN